MRVKSSNCYDINNQKYLSKNKQEISLSTFIKNIDFNSGFFLHKYFDKGYIKIIVFHSKLNKVKKNITVY